ncbi:MAG: ABC transporter ATP-binding protein [Alphaproteobacteria bacterium]|nr:ABC transporter ATP-binding protein [Alphaproteobacteria bacterium]
MSHIQVNAIEKSFADTKVLQGVQLDIRGGEFLTLVGPSGCGKSTLLRIIAGLERQTSGDVVIAGRNVNGVRASERDLAMVFQSYALYPHLTVRDNMMTPLRLRDLSKAQRTPLVGRYLPGSKKKLAGIRETVEETADILKIRELLARKPGQLSGGQRQRAALGRAMVRRPVAFLMDEPLSNLDAALRVHMRAELTDLHRRLQATFVYVTHDQAEALTMSSRVAVMMDGRILQLDTPMAVYADPVSRRVAEFIGSPKINILPGRLDSAGRVTVLGHSMARRITDAAAQSVSVGIRPEHLIDVPTDSDAAEYVGVVRRLEHLGSDLYIHASLSDGQEMLIIRSDPDAAARYSYGDPITIAQVKGAALIFDDKGDRLRTAPKKESAGDDALEVA